MFTSHTKFSHKSYKNINSLLDSKVRLVGIDYLAINITGSIWRTVLIMWITSSNHWSNERTKHISAKELLQDVWFIEIRPRYTYTNFFASCLTNVFY